MLSNLFRWTAAVTMIAGIVLGLWVGLWAGPKPGMAVAGLLAALSGILVLYARLNTRMEISAGIR